MNTHSAFIDSSDIRYAFSLAMSKMYQHEVPLYADLIDLVNDINAEVINKDPIIKSTLERTGEINRLGVERHGAIRLGSAEELATMRRLFAVMGMQPVGYYDLTAAGVPVHSTAFRAIDSESLSRSPFRVFTSLLRLDLIASNALRAKAEAALTVRNIFTEGVIALINTHETKGGLTQEQGQAFVVEALETFRWHETSPISKSLYEELLNEHRLIVDIVGFKGPHINHLTPRTLDIDAAQQGMIARGIPAKDIIEGPPRRHCPILLRQTSFKALEESVNFTSAVEGITESGYHTARFGEIEQRGAALTPKGRALYDNLLTQARARLGETPNKSNAAQYYAILQDTFNAFSDDYQTLYEQQLAYFYYYPTDYIENSPVSNADNNNNPNQHFTPEDMDVLIQQEKVQIEPIVYEDFLPVSAAGIFQSNLAKDTTNNVAHYEHNAHKENFEHALGAKVYDETELYAQMQSKSLASCLAILNNAR